MNDQLVDYTKKASKWILIVVLVLSVFAVFNLPSDLGAVIILFIVILALFSSVLIYFLAAKLKTISNHLAVSISLYILSFILLGTAYYVEPPFRNPDTIIFFGTLIFLSSPLCIFSALATYLRNKKVLSLIQITLFVVFVISLIIIDTQINNDSNRLKTQFEQIIHNPSLSSCQSIPTIAESRPYTYYYQYYIFWCFTNLAKQEKDENVCNSLYNYPDVLRNAKDSVNNCITYVAEDRKNASICMSIDTTHERSNCLRDVYIGQSKNISICDTIPKEYSKSECIKYNTE